jgi:hypothetical protein
LTEIISKGSFVDYLCMIDYLSPTSHLAGEGQEKSTSISKTPPSLLGEGGWGDEVTDKQEKFSLNLFEELSFFYIEI